MKILDFPLFSVHKPWMHFLKTIVARAFPAVGIVALLSACAQQVNLNGAYARVLGPLEPGPEDPVRLLVDRHHMRVTFGNGDTKVKWIHVERQGRDFLYTVHTDRRGEAVGDLTVEEEDRLSFMGHQFKRVIPEDHERPVR